MSSRPQIKAHAVVTDGDMSADFTSEVTVITNISMISYSYSWQSAIVGGLVTVEASDDYEQNADGSVRNPGTWSALPLSNGDTTVVITGGPESGVISCSDLAFAAIRTRYTAQAGSGLMQVIIAGKVA